MCKAPCCRPAGSQTGFPTLASLCGHGRSRGGKMLGLPKCETFISAQCVVVTTSDSRPVLRMRGGRTCRCALFCRLGTLSRATSCLVHCSLNAEGRFGASWVYGYTQHIMCTRKGHVTHSAMAACACSCVRMQLRAHTMTSPPAFGNDILS